MTDQEMASVDERDARSQDTQNRTRSGPEDHHISESSADQTSQKKGRKDGSQLRKLLVKWAQSNRGEEVLLAFQKKLNLSDLFERAQQARRMLLEGQQTMQKVFEEALLPLYYLLEKMPAKQSSSDIQEREDRFNQWHIRRMMLTQLYVCTHSLKPEGSATEELEKIILLELFTTGIDETVLLASDMQQIPHDYIRQVCFLTPDDSGTPGEEVDAEESARVTQQLLLEYSEMQSKRYARRQAAFAKGIKTDLEGMAVMFEQKQKIRSVTKKQDLGRILDPRRREELIEEGEQISQMLQFGSVVPEREAITYYIISQQWFTRWQKYTGCFKVEDSDDDENDDVFRKKDKSDIVLGPYPGPINEKNDLNSISAPLRDVIWPINDEFAGFYLKAGAKEGQAYQVVSQEIWDMLSSRYGGRALRRYSVAVPTDNPMRPDYIVECQLRRFRILTWPKVKYFPKALTDYVYVSRGDTVKELIARACNSAYFDEVSEKIGGFLARSCRMWVMEGDTDFQDVQEGLDGENMPTEIQGRLLQPYQLIQDINVADNESIILEWRVALQDDAKVPFAYEPKPNATRKAAFANHQSNLPEELARIEDPEELLRQPLSALLDTMNKKTRLGLTGMQNLGNTCFMNSVLQCLANTEPLTKFFLFEVYWQHLNRKNALGTRGRLAEAFANLVQDVWLGKSSHVAPWDVKSWVARKAVQFQGFAQHDSQEMLSVLLETMHEDTNAVSKKPYVEMKDSNGRPDAVVAKEFWDALKMRDDSIFVKLFYGQLKSRVNCSICGNVSITFDPFNVLSVPIPRGASMSSTYQIRFYPLSFVKPVVQVTLSLSQGDRTTVGDIKEKVRQSILDQAKDDGKQVALEDIPLPIICIVKDSKIETMVRSDFEIRDLEKGFKLAALERPDHDPDTSKVVVVQLMVTQQKSSYIMWKTQQPLTQSRLLILRKDATCRSIKKHIFKLFRPIVQGSAPMSGEVNRNDGDYNEETVLEREYKAFFEDNQMDYDSENIGNPLYKLQVLNNLPIVPGMFYNGRKRCEICDREHKDNCEFAPANDKLKLSQLLNSLEDRDLIIVAHWRNNPQANMQLIEKPTIVDQDQTGGFKMAGGAVSIYDCLNFSQMEETLSGNDKWYCGRCKDHVTAQKKMEVYRAPDYLIIHLKRFSHTRNSMFGSRKINDHINFPVNGLDLSQYVISENGGQIYDLYAVSNHFGSLNGGHYTAFAKNPYYGKWFNFDDTHVEKVHENDAITKAAYVLFYKRRGTTL